jgi:hypothetical protein
LNFIGKEFDVTGFGALLRIPTVDWLGRPVDGFRTASMDFDTVDSSLFYFQKKILKKD